MKYTWYINYIKCKEFWINLNQWAIMDLMTLLPLWAEWEVIDWEIYYYFTAQKVIDEIPVITESKRTVLSNIQVLKEKWLLSHKIHNNKGYYKLTELWKTFIFQDKKISVKNSAHSEEGVQKSTYECAENDIPGMQNSAYNNNTNYNTYKNNNKISKDILLDEKTKKSFLEIFQEKILENNEFLEKVKTKFEITNESLKSSAENFLIYWTEKNENWRKERWQMQKTFDIQKRFFMWLSNEKKWRNNKSLSKTWYVVDNDF